MDETWEELHAEAGLTLAVYRHVREHPGVDSEDVARALGVGPVAASDAVAWLVGVGLLDFDGEEA